MFYTLIMEEIKAIEPICPIYFNARYFNKKEIQKEKEKEKKSNSEYKKSFEEYLKEALKSKRD